MTSIEPIQEQDLRDCARCFRQRPDVAVRALFWIPLCEPCWHHALDAWDRRPRIIERLGRFAGGE